MTLHLTNDQARRLGQVLRDAPINTCRIVQREAYQPVSVTLWAPKGETVLTIDERGVQKFLRLPDGD